MHLMMLCSALPGNMGHLVCVGMGSLWVTGIPGTFGAMREALT
jgi:hypothetical protein